MSVPNGQAGRVTIIHKEGNEWLSAALEAGHLSAEALRQCQTALAENTTLRRANVALSSKVEILEAIHQSDRATLREALNQRARCWRLWRKDKPALQQGIVVGAGLGMAMMSIAMEIARWIAR